MAETGMENGVIGFTDTGAPVVLSEHSCAYWRPGPERLLKSRTCWYCRWADFRKTTCSALAQSICRCPQNRVPVVAGSENEALEARGEAR